MPITVRFFFKNRLKKTITTQLYLSRKSHIQILPHSAPSWILSNAENLASFSLQDGATKWYYFLSETGRPPGHPATRPPGHPTTSMFYQKERSVPTYFVCPHLLCLSPPIMSALTNYVCPHPLCLSPPVMSVPTYCVCPQQLCLSPPIMSVSTYYVCPYLLCLSPPIMSVPTYDVCQIIWCKEIFLAPRG